MTVDLNIIIISFAVALLVSVFLPLFVRWASKRWDLSDVFLSTDKIITLIQLIVNASNASDSSKSIVNIITTGASKAVEYAEQLYLNGNISANERKAKAIEYVELALKEMNIEITEDRMK